MLSVMDGYLTQRALELFFVTALGVLTVSGAAWIVALRLSIAALRHVILVSALACTLAMPGLVWCAGAMGLRLVVVPILGPPREIVRSAAPHDSGLYDRLGIDKRRQATNETAAVVAQPPAGEPIAETPQPYAPQVDARAESVARDVASAPSVTLAPTEEKSPARSPWSYRDVVAATLVVWACGVVLLLARLGRDYLRLALLRRSARPCQNATHLAILRNVADALGARRVPQLLISKRAVTPLALGMVQPAVLLPDGLLAAMSDDELSDILVHEVTHLVRSDQRTVLWECLAGALYWPILTVHAMNRALRRAREELCDNTVLAGRGAIEYAETLLRVAEFVVCGRSYQVPRNSAAVGILDGAFSLECRITGMIDPRRNRATKTSRRVAYAVVLMFVAVGTILAATRLAVYSSTQPETTATSAAEAANDPDNPPLAGHFEGTVLDAAGKPIAHARIHLAPFMPTPKSIGPVRAESDDAGHFAIDAPDMTYKAADGLPARREGLIVATAAGFAPDWMQTWGHNSESGAHWNPVKGADIRLFLAKDDVPIHGLFLDPEGKPLADARVRIEYVLIPWKRNLDQAIAKLQNMLIVQDYERPVHCAELLPGFISETRTDADGRFTLTGIGRERLVQLQVSAPSIIDTAVMVMTRAVPDVGIRLGANGKPTEFLHGANFTRQLKPGLSLQGVVRDRETHAPISGMWVTLNGGNPQLEPEAAADAVVSDEQGRFTITGLSPGLLDSRDERLFELTGANPAMIRWNQQGLHVMAYPQPGETYVTSQGFVESDGQVIIECVHGGIPFRLKLVDERGAPVEAPVEYWPISPNWEIASSMYSGRHFNRAVGGKDGLYNGFVLPGPGAVVVKKPDGSYRSAHVDPKKFFEPRRTDWSGRERFYYGTDDTLAIGQGWDDQHRYAAIVLVNPARGAGPLELSATVQKDQPREVTLVDPDGQPVTDVETQGMTFDPWDSEAPLRAPSFQVADLAPDRPRRIVFLQNERRLVGELLARGDDTTPYTVRMQPWGTVTGRLLEEDGTPLSGNLIASLNVVRATPATDAEVSEFDHEQLAYVETNGGRFRAERLIPGVAYNAKVYRGRKSAGLAFENLVLKPGEVRDLGDIRTKKPVDERRK